MSFHNTPSTLTEDSRCGQRRTLVSIAALISLALLGGCAVGPDYRRPDLALPESYPAAPAAVAASSTAPSNSNAASPGADEDVSSSAVPAMLTQQWWTLFGDAELNRLIEAAQTSNADIAIAVARIDEADAVLRQTGSALFPQFDLGASGVKARASQLNAQPTQPGVPLVTKSNRAAISTSFEIDLWGKLRRATEAARAQALGSRYARDVTALALAGATAQAYFALRSLEAQIDVSRITVEARDESLKVVQSRARGGLASDLDVNQAQGALADARVQYSDLQRQRALIEHQLATLTGRLDLKLVPGDLRQLPTPPLPPAGLPSALLERRPDVRQAEQELVAANADIGYAQALRLPSFSLTGLFGGQSEAFRDVLDGDARIWSAGLGMTVPLLDFGRGAARTDAAKARQRQAAAGYRKTAEQAFREVADALANVAQSGASETDLQARAEAARNALRLAKLRYEAGYSAYLDVLDAQRTANEAELALLRSREARLSYSVDLMKALGGGWTPSKQ